MSAPLRQLLNQEERLIVNYQKLTRITALLALLIVAFTLSACGGNATDTPVSATATTVTGATTSNTPATSMTNTQAMAANTPATSMTNTQMMGMTPTAGMMMTNTQMMGTPGTAMTSTQAMSGTGSSATFSPITGGATQLTAGGGTFPAPLYQKWFADFGAKYGVTINYQAKGSGFGKQNIQNQTLDFGASDAPMTDAELAAAKGGPMIEIPTCLGAVVLTYNIPGYSGTLKLDGDTLAKIYLGTIKDWSDPAVTAANGGTALPAGAIQVVHRSDSSGTSFIFTSYLAAVNADWKDNQGASQAPSWPAGQGASGNAGVAGQVKTSPFSIGYIEIAYAIQNNLPFADMKNQSGKYITASLDTVKAAAANLTSIPADLRFSLVNEPGDTSYPIASSTWELVYQNQTNKAKAIAVVNLLNWELTVGQGTNNSLNYGVLPANLQQAAIAKVKTIMVNGAPVQP